MFVLNLRSYVSESLLKQKERLITHKEIIESLRTKLDGVEKIYNNIAFNESKASKSFRDHSKYLQGVRDSIITYETDLLKSKISLDKLDEEIFIKDVEIPN
jgi:hypothetical protein